eukprot:TRINITY_DN1368_c0_g1_i1.p1 TRINITY_DN1368_c0_g1~~TRINITY_DN1368_c0_g1_i1.p1  ORF type:complete len:163 (+),score=52.74 TRINITY_DN1368_c0_g1_i1:55-543(+)
MSEIHGAPTGECLICCCDMDETNYAEFKGAGTDFWKASPYCSPCIEGYFKAKQWEKYLETLEKAQVDCAAALRRVLAKGPPLYVHDKAFASDVNPDGVVDSFWYVDVGVVSSKIVGALEGDERQKFWDEKNEFLAALEVAEAESGDMALLKKQEAAAAAKTH